MRQTSNKVRPGPGSQYKLCVPVCFLLTKIFTYGENFQFLRCQFRLHALDYCADSQTCCDTGSKNSRKQAKLIMGYPSPDSWIPRCLSLFFIDLRHSLCSFQFASKFRKFGKRVEMARLPSENLSLI